jgi:hypothetical protein
MSDLSALYDDPHVEEICVSGDVRLVACRHGALKGGWLTGVSEADLDELVAWLAERRGGSGE